MKLNKVAEGKHNGKIFKYEDGFLLMFNNRWDKEDIKTLVETANLLSIEGYDLKIPTGKTKTLQSNLFGLTSEFEVKNYSAENEEEI